LISCEQTSSQKQSSQLTYDFYHWLIYENYLEHYNKGTEYLLEPEITKKGQNQYTIKSNRYISVLKDCGFLSESFIQGEVDKIDRCNKKIARVSFTAEEDLVYSDYKECAFLSYYEWLGGQGEDISGFKVVQVKELAETSTVIIQVLIADLESGPQFNVKLKKYFDAWKIEKIEML